MRQQQALQAQQMAQVQIAQPTGFGQVWFDYVHTLSLIFLYSSNNPFAPSVSPASVSPAPSGANGTSNGPVFNLQGTFASSNAPSYTSTPPPASTSSTPSRADTASTGIPSKGPTRTDQEHSHLATLLANRDDGQDTFGNVGMLRYGYTQAGRSAAQKVSGGGVNNPFAQANQQQPQSGHNNEQPFFSI